MFQVEPIEGVAASERRGVYWLRGALSLKEEAKSTLLELDPTDPIRRKLQRAFDYWVNGHPNDKLHHGWDKSEYEGEFVKMHAFKGNDYRLYGLKINPLPSNLRYQACILIGSYRSKKRYEAPVETMRRFLVVGDKREFTTSVESYFEGQQ